MLCQILRFLKGNQGTSRAANNNKQPCLCQTSLRNSPFNLVECISLHLKSPDLYSFCKTKVFPKFLLPSESQESLFGSYDYAPWSLSLVAWSSLDAHAHGKKETPLQSIKNISFQLKKIFFYDLNNNNNNNFLIIIIIILFNFKNMYINYRNIWSKN